MEEIVLNSLIFNKLFFTKAFSSLDNALFENSYNSIIFDEMSAYINKYQTKPTPKELGFAISENANLNINTKKSTIQKYKEIVKQEQINNIEFLIDKTQKWVQKRKLTDAIYKSAELIEKDKEFEPIIGMISDALQTSFDKDTGLDYKDSILHRIEYYHRKLKGLSTGIPTLDAKLGGGFMPKTLNILAGPSHSGKSSLKVCIATNQLYMGKNVLYVTLEMSEEEILKRVDANILDININELNTTSKDKIESTLNKIKDNIGNMKVKEYPAGTFDTLKLEALMTELEQEGFIPDAIFIDYLGLMSSSRTTLAKSGGTYNYVKSIAEECHGFAKRYNLPIITSAQLNRSAFNNPDSGMENVSESIGIAATADVMINIINTDQLREQKQTMLKFVKNRNTGMLDNVLLNIDFEKMRYTEFDGDLDNMSSNTNNTNTSSTVQSLTDDNFDFGGIKF